MKLDIKDNSKLEEMANMSFYAAVSNSCCMLYRPYLCQHSVGLIKSINACPSLIIREEITLTRLAAFESVYSRLVSPRRYIYQLFKSWFKPYFLHSSESIQAFQALCVPGQLVQGLT